MQLVEILSELYYIILYYIILYYIILYYIILYYIILYYDARLHVPQVNIIYLMTVILQHLYFLKSLLSDVLMTGDFTYLYQLTKYIYLLFNPTRALFTL